MTYSPGDQYYHETSKNKLKFFITIYSIYNNQPAMDTVGYTVHKYSVRKHIPVKSSNNTLYLKEFDDMIQKYYKKYDKPLVLGSDRIE